MDMVRVTIYKPTKSAMQSGNGNSKCWLLKFDSKNSRYTDPLMGWTGSHDMNNEIDLTFTTKEEAINFAINNKLTYEVIEPKEKRIKPKSYAANFTS